MPRKTLYTMYRTYMMKYRLKEEVGRSRAEVMYWYGEKEMREKVGASVSDSASFL